MKRVVPLIFLGTLTMSVLPAFSAPIGAYNQIMQAVYVRDEATLKYLVSVGLNINAVNMQGKTALCTTVENQDHEGYELLLSQGATTRTPCMKNMNPEVLSKFAADHPPIGTYYEGAALTASRNGVLLEGVKEAATGIASLPVIPHLGEILLAGVAVGTAFAVGVHGSGGGGDDPPIPTQYSYASPFDNSDPTASNYLNPAYFSSPTVDTLSKTQKGGISDVTEELVTQYENEYAGGVWYQPGSTSPINNINFLETIRSEDAYARGYSGAIVNRDADGNPTATGWDAVSNNKVKVAVMDTGLFYHSDLLPTLYTDWITDSSTDTYKQSVGLNYEYGVKSAANNSSYWKCEAEDEGKSYVRLYKNGTAVGDLLFEIGSDLWVNYMGKFAPKCGLGSDANGNCLKAGETICELGGGCYKNVDYVSGYGTEGETSLASYSIIPDLWDEYVAKYGKTGYVYDAANATPNFFEEEGYDIDHGTHVSGVIAALRNGVGMQGVAYNAEILPVKVDLNMPYGLFSRIADVASNAKIINLSVAPSQYIIVNNQEVPRTISNSASSFVSNNLSKTSQYWDNLKIIFDTDETYATIATKGAVQVFSAGNHGQYQPSIYTAAPLIDPSFKNLVLSVVALGAPSEATYHTNTGDITSYSNRCGATASYCLAAPGGDETEPIVSTGISSVNLTGAYTGKAGTSQAAPIVSGSLAVLMGAFPFLTPQQAVEILLKKATYIKPDAKEITAYNTLAGDSNAYASNTVDGEYNAIYGRGLVNLDAATDPVGVPKITFDTVASSNNTELASISSLQVSSMMTTSLRSLPKKIIVLDDYTRAYEMSTGRFIKAEKRHESLRRSFRSFMAYNEKEVPVSNTLSFAFNEAAADKTNMKTGAMSMVMRPNKNIKMRLGFTEDSASFGGSYAERSLQNPFMNMRQAFGMDAGVNLTKNWALIGSWYTGKNGFVDEDTFDKMSKQPRMNLVESGVAYQGIENLTLGVSGGIMNEEESLLGTRGAGAFRTDGSETHFVRVVANYQPTSKFRLSGSYTYGMTKAKKVSSLMNVSALTSDSFALTAEYMPDEKKTFGVKLVSPLRIRSGNIRFDLPVARDMYEDKIYREVYTAGVKPVAREYDLSVFYANEISTALSWAGETGVRLNPDHQNISPDYRALFKLNWMW